MTKKQPELKTAADVETKLDEITAFVRTSIKAIEEDKDVDLADLEDSVDNVCEAFSMLKESDAARLDKNLKAMIKSLEELSGILRNHPDFGDDEDYDDEDDEDDEDYDDGEEETKQ